MAGARVIASAALCIALNSCSDCNGGNRAEVDAGSSSATADAAVDSSGPLGTRADLAELRVHLIVGTNGMTAVWLWDETVKDAKACPQIDEATTKATLNGATMQMTAVGGASPSRHATGSPCAPISFSFATPTVANLPASSDGGSSLDGGAIEAGAGAANNAGASFEITDGSKTATIDVPDLFAARKLAFVNHSPRFKPGDKIVVKYMPDTDVILITPDGPDPTDFSSMSEGLPRVFEMIVRSQTALKDVREKATGREPLTFEGELVANKVEGVVPVGPVDIDFAWPAVYRRHAKVAKCDVFKSCAATPSVPGPIKIELTR